MLIGDYNGHFQGEYMYSTKKGWPYLLRKRIWDRIGGNGSIVQFYVYPRDELRYQGICKFSNDIKQGKLME